MVKLRPGTAPGAQRELFLVAGRNEFVSFQVGIQGGLGGLRVEHVSLPELRGPAVITGKDIVLYREAFLDITVPSVPEAEPGPWPDGLIPSTDESVGETRLAFPFFVPPSETRAIWVDVHVPEDAPPGHYQGRAQVTAEEGSVEVRLHLTVVDALIPSTSSLKTAFFLAPHYVCRAYTGKLECGDEELSQLLMLFHRMGLEHRLTLTGAFPRVRGGSRWSPQDWEAFTARWGLFLDGSQLLRLRGAQVTGWQYAGPASAPGLSDFVGETQARGWLPRAFDYVGDEPPYISTFEQVRQRATLTRGAAPQLRTLLASNIDVLREQHLEPFIDIIAVLVNALDRPPSMGGKQREHYTQFLAQPRRELWLYQSCESHGCGGVAVPENQPGQGWPSYMVDRPASKARAQEWVAFLEGATGELYYQTAELLDTAWASQLHFHGNGDGTLFYPGTAAAIGGSTPVPLPSLRLKLIRLGLQDYEWLQAVSKAGDPEYARKVALRVVPSAWRVPDDGSLFENARLCLISRYLELTHPSQPGLALCPEDFLTPPEE